MLLDLLGRGLSENAEGLKSLTVTVQVLSPDLLDVLAEKLPQLERLEANFTYLRTTDVSTDAVSRSGNDVVDLDARWPCAFLTSFEIDGALMKMWREPGSIWRAKNRLD